MPVWCGGCPQSNGGSMDIRRRAGFVVGAVMLSVGLAASPAFGVDAPDAAELVALSAKDPRTGDVLGYEVGPGQAVPAVLGVINSGEEPVDGLVVQVRVVNDLDLATKYANCWY